MYSINKPSIQDHVVKSVQLFISEHSLSSGDQLPSQGEMSQMFGVSRTSLREAIKKLEAFDVVEVKKGKGVYVKDPSSGPTAWKEREKKITIQALQLRKVLEREIIRLVVESASQAEIDEIEGYLNLAIEKHARGEDQNAEDKMFHQSMYKYCHNPLINQVVESVADMFELFWKYPLGITKPFMDTIPLHKQTFDMIKEKRVDEAIKYNDMAIDVVINEILDY